MSLKLFDFECSLCGAIKEHLVENDVDCMPCDECGRTAKKIISMPGVNCANQDAPWIRSVLEVVAKDSIKPHTQEFVKYPTRDNYRKWMKGEGLRHVEDGEKVRKPDMSGPSTDTLMKMCQKRRAIEVRSR